MKNDFNNLRLNTLRMFSELDDRHRTENCDDVRALVDAIRESLAPPECQLGMWETFELNCAEQSLASGFPRLALISAAKALAISQLSQQEYIYGFSVVRQDSSMLAERNSIRADTKMMQEEAANDLSTSHKDIAVLLVTAEEKTATNLETAQEKTAITLKVLQIELADSVAAINLMEANDLVEIQAVGLVQLKADDVRSQLHDEAQVQAMAWMAGGYSVECFEKDALCHDSYTRVDCAQKNTAAELKARQDNTALALEQVQEKTAHDLKEVEKIDAVSLKTEQYEAAMTLQENQAIKALRKKTADQIVVDNLK